MLRVKSGESRSACAFQPGRAGSWIKIANRSARAAALDGATEAFRIRGVSRCSDCCTVGSDHPDHLCNLLVANW